MISGMGVLVRDFEARRKSSFNGLKLNTISQEEKKRRDQIINYARASVGLEGFVPSASAETDALRYVNGEMDMEEFVSLGLDGPDALTPKECYQFESDRTFRRAAELRDSPVKDNFAAAHLKEINRRLFQDLTGAGFKDVTPGVYRPETDKWYKIRRLTSRSLQYFVAYSTMDQSSRERLDKILEEAKPEKLKGLDPNEFKARIGVLYADMDYIHPFLDGNSRTLREFTRQLANDSGYKVDWERFVINPAGRDHLYLARDLSVFERSINEIKDDQLLHQVLISQYRLKENRHFPDLVKDAIQPI